jgi:hypothetical protein
MNGKQVKCQVGATTDDGRPKDDFYETCPEAVYGLLAKEDFRGGIWEPACGGGAISKILMERGYAVLSTDLYDHGYGNVGERWDFLKQPKGIGGYLPKNIITNPPFKLTSEFMLAGWQHIERTHGKLCLLGRLLWLEGIKRGKIFQETELSRVWVFSKRIPHMHRPGWAGKRSGSLVAFAWYVWDWRAPCESDCFGTIVGWINPEEMRDDYIK